MYGSDPKQIARELLEEAHPALIGLSHWIHANPELGYQEVLASGWVTEWLTTAGFDVRTGVAGMPTAVVGSYGPGPFHVAVCVEYDALPAVGHACGHNVIAAAGVGAGLAIAAVADQLGLRVTVMGTPAEETGGGKIGLIKAGELDGVHAAMMVHPWPDDQATPPVIAIRSLNVAYSGTAAHAAGYPHLGVNAADALVIAQTAIALLRQQLRPTDRVHGIVTKGGDAPNIIPARTEAQWMVRGTDVARLDEVTALVRRCFEAGALATGATLEIQEEICYADVRHDPDLADLYRSNAQELGRVFAAAGMPLSTDMGNISYVVPTIHPMIGVEANGAVNHQAEFAAACATPSADQAILDGAIALAWTAIDAAQDEEIRRRLMAFQPDPGEVAMVSSAWMLPPVAAAPGPAQTPGVVDETRIQDVESELTEESPVAGALLVAEFELADAAADPEAMQGAVEARDLAPAWASVDAEAEAMLDIEAIAGVDPDSAWAADVDAVAQELAAAGLLQDDPEQLGMATAGVDEVLFVGFEDGPAEPAEVVTLAAAEDLPVDTEQVLDVWVTPEALGEWLEEPAAAEEPAPTDAPPAAAEAPPAAATPAVAVPAVATALQDHDAWQRAFEEAAASRDWDGRFEAAVSTTDRAPGSVDAAEARDEVAVTAAWPPQERELTSRERIEAEGFAFVAPEVSSPLDERGDVWSRNGDGADHAGEDVRLR